MDSEHGTTPVEPAGSAKLSDEQKSQLLSLARQALHDYLRDGKLPPFTTEVPALLKHRASFVTLRRSGTGELRGCRGECFARRPLIESVVHMAIAAATDDSRFPPVTYEEVPELDIEISALTPLEPISPEDVVVGQHGLLIVKGGKSGLLLPQVPVTYGWKRDKYLKALCWKAGLDDDAWQAEDTQLYGFATEAWGEGLTPTEQLSQHDG